MEYLPLGKLLLKLVHRAKRDQQGPEPLGGSRGVSSWVLSADPHPGLPTEIPSVPFCCWHRSPEGWTCSSLHRYPRPPARDWLVPLLRCPPGSTLPPLTHTASFPSFLHTLPWDKRELQALAFGFMKSREQRQNFACRFQCL